jgi:hypothetical protein
VNHRDLGANVAQPIMRCPKLCVRVFEPVNDLCPEIVDARVELRNVLLRRHALDDMREHFANILERRFFCCHHTMKVYHTAPS